MIVSVGADEMLTLTIFMCNGETRGVGDVKPEEIKPLE